MIFDASGYVVSHASHNRMEEVDHRYTHDLRDEDEPFTFCGINCERDRHVPISCDCGLEECKHKTTCPVCITLKSGKVS